MNAVGTIAAFDPILVEIISNDLGAVAEEMAAIIHKTGRSAMLKAGDFATIVCDAEGRAIGQGVGATFQAVLFEELVRNVVARHGGTLVPGDVIVSNDRRGMTHLPDVAAVMPVFAEERLAGFVAAYSHHADVGGRFPGGQNQAAASALEEGLRIPLIKLVEAGAFNQAALDLIRANVRLDEEWVADLQAKIAGCRRGAEGFSATLAKYGLATFEAVCETMLDGTEKAARAALAALPDGVYEAEDGLPDDGSGAGDIVLKLRIAIDGERLVADFAGSSGQVACALNMPLLFAKSGVIGGLHALIGHDIAVNSGFFRAIEVYAPARTIVNPDETFPIGARAPLFTRVFDMVFRALAHAAPDRMPVPHESGDAIHYSGTDAEGDFFALFDVYFGGWGARPDKDGIDGVAPVYMGSYGSISGELIERQYPVQLLGFGYVPDSAGAGKYRGSVGVYRTWRFARPGKVMLRQLRLAKGDGLNGGEAGALGETLLTRADGSELAPPPQSHQHLDVGAGDLLYHSISGAGGFGDPFARDPAAVLEDVHDEKTSIEAARRDYGVAIEGGRIDAAATARLRAARPPSAPT